MQRNAMEHNAMQRKAMQRNATEQGASAVNNPTHPPLRGNTLRGRLLCALYAPASNYWPRPAVIIPITSRTEESVTQRAGQGEGKATEQPINISFTHPHPPPPSLAILEPPSPTPHPPPWIKFPGGKGGREGGKKRVKQKRKETRSIENITTQGL